MSDCDRPVRLAQSGSLTVDRCSCGLVHVTIGSTTLHLDDRAFFHVARQLDVAAEALAARHVMTGGHPTLRLVTEDS